MDRDTRRRMQTIARELQQRLYPGLGIPVTVWAALASTKHLAQAGAKVMY
jgi:hypothetical protein